MGAIVVVGRLGGLLWVVLLGVVGGPHGGGNAWFALRGGDGHNSYYVGLERWLSWDGQVDVEEVYGFFVDQGWQAQKSVAGDSDGYVVRGETGDGYVLEFEKAGSDYYVLKVQKGMFWADTNQLSRNVLGRIPKDEKFPPGQVSVPGVFIEFPDWDDPVRDPLDD